MNVMLTQINKKNKGFTLVELIVVIAILVILAALLIPSISGYIDDAKGVSAITLARQACVSSTSGLLKWKAAGSPGNSDAAYKKNIELEIINYLGLDSTPMQSYIESNKAPENTVQVALSLPSAYSQGWEQFIKDCKTNSYKNFFQVWVGKNKDYTIGDSIKAVYYVSADGKYAGRVVLDGSTKLGSPDQRTGTYYQRIDKD